MSQLVPAGRNKMRSARLLFRRERAHRFQPANQAAAAFAGRTPPTAARRHHHQRGESRLRAIDRRPDVVSLRLYAIDVRDDTRWRALPRLLFQPFAVFAADLQRGRTNGVFEVGAVDRTQARTRAFCDDEQGPMAARATCRFIVCAVFGAWRQLDQSKLCGAAEYAELAAHAVRIGKCRVKERQTIDALAADLDKTVHRIDTVEFERFERRLDAEFAHFRREPISGSFVALRAGAMNTLRIVSLDQTRNPLVGFSLNAGRVSRCE